MEIPQGKLKTFLGDVYGLETNDITPLKRGFVNYGFLVSDTKGNKFVLRISSQKTLAEVSFEVEVLLKLSESNINAPRLIPNLKGEYLSAFTGKPVVLYEFLDGEVPEEVDVKILREWGGYIGKMHAILEDFRPTFRKSTWEPEELPKLFREGKQELLSVGGEDARAVLEFCEEHLQTPISKSGLPSGITHQDLKHENIIAKDGHLAGVVDFDNTYVGTLLYDLLTPIMWDGYKGENLDKERVTALTLSYHQERPLTREEILHVPEAFRLRLIREVFIGPFAAITDKESAMRRARLFMRKYECYTLSEAEMLQNIFTEVTK